MAARDPSHAQLKQFVTKCIAPVMSKETDTVEHLSRLLMVFQTDETWISSPKVKKQVIWCGKQLSRANKQHNLLLDQWIAIKHEIGEEMDPESQQRAEQEIDIGFNLWLARKSIRANDLRAGTLFIDYLRENGTYLYDFE